MYEQKNSLSSLILLKLSAEKKILSTDLLTMSANTCNFKLVAVFNRLLEINLNKYKALKLRTAWLAQLCIFNMNFGLQGCYCTVACCID